MLSCGGKYKRTWVLERSAGVTVYLIRNPAGQRLGDYSRAIIGRKMSGMY